MAEKRGKVITTLRERRWIESELQSMLEARTEAEFMERAIRVAGSGRQVIPVILNSLDTSNSQILGVLGVIAAYLDTDEIVFALRGVATSSDRSDRERMAALLILDRFLEEELDEELFGGLQNPQEIAIQSLVEMLDEVEENRFTLLEYVYALKEQPPEIVQAIVETMRELEEERTVEPLRLLAQDERRPVAQKAIYLLGTIRSPLAVKALRTLLPTVAPDLQPLVERSVRKLGLSGVKVEPLPAPDKYWRALISPLDGQGNQSLWFIHHVPPQETCRFLAVLIDDHLGIKSAFGDEEAPVERFPARKPIGVVHFLTMVEPGLMMLETDFDYGRRLVLESLKRNWATGAPLPLEYCLLNDLLWMYDLPETLYLPQLPVLEGHMTHTVKETLPYVAALLDHPAFANWFLQSELVYRATVKMLTDSSSEGGPFGVRAGLSYLIQSYFDDKTVALYRSRLEAMSEWLTRAQDDQMARLALVAALALDEVPAEHHPLLMHLLERELKSLVHDKLQ
jgi:hypothetical protein